LSTYCRSNFSAFYPSDWTTKLAAFSESNGAVRSVTDEQILEAYNLLGRSEGIFCEPASAASVAGLLVHGAGGAEDVVCVLTGNGLKDPDTALAQGGEQIPCAVDLDAMRQVVLG
jgi:threonine synthase